MLPVPARVKAGRKRRNYIMDIIHLNSAIDRVCRRLDDISKKLDRQDEQFELLISLIRQQCVYFAYIKEQLDILT